MIQAVIIFNTELPFGRTEGSRLEIQCRLALPGVPANGDVIKIMDTHLIVDHITFVVDGRETRVEVVCAPFVTSQPNTIVMNWEQKYFNVTYTKK